MRRADTILFDLDGTLTDSGTGIINGVEYALKKIGMRVDNKESLRCFIGPPLQEKFCEFCRISMKEAGKMVEFYREYYTGKGIFENSVYSGIPELLQYLQEQGVKLAIATSKPEKFARIIAKHFDIERYFDFIGGARMDGTRTKKSEVIEYVLEECRFVDRENIWMVGDREHDILGAKTTGLFSVGVLYGYGDRKELEIAGANKIIKSPGELVTLWKEGV